MSVILCIGKTLSISDNATVAFTIMFAFLSVYCWISTVTFIYSFCRKHGFECKQNSSRITDRTLFDILTISVITIISIASITLTIMGLFYVHFVHPHSNIDYENICSKYNIKFWDIWWFVWPFGSFINNFGYVLLLYTYYYRLILIFKGSLFEISKNTKILLIIFITITFLIDICIIVSMILKDLDYAATFWLIFLISYSITSLYLCYILKTQFTLLLKFSTTSKLGNNMNSNININSNSTRTRKMEEIKSTMKRFTILIYFAICVTFWNFLFYLIFFVFFHKIDVFNNSNLALLLFFFVLLIDSNVNIISICSQFQFYSIYYNLICKRFEDCTCICNTTCNCNINCNCSKYKMNIINNYNFNDKQSEKDSKGMGVSSVENSSQR